VDAWRPARLPWQVPASGLIAPAPSSAWVAGRTLFLRDNEPVGATRAEDTLAIEIYRRAEESGERIMPGTVERRLSDF